MKVAIATACGNKKREGTWPIHSLYFSPRIKALYSRKGDLPLYILSAQYGLIHSDQIVSSYQRVMDFQRAKELAPQVSSAMKQYDWLVYFKAGARQEYADCIKLAASLSGVSIVLVGYAFMGGLDDCLSTAAALRSGRLPDKSIRSLEVYRKVL